MGTSARTSFWVSVVASCVAFGCSRDPRPTSDSIGAEKKSDVEKPSKKKKKKKPAEPPPDDEDDAEKPQKPKTKDGAKPIEVARGPGIRLVGAQGEQVWWRSAKELHMLRLSKPTPEITPIDGPHVAAGPAGTAWMTYDAACTTGAGTCKATVVARPASGGAATDVVTLPPDDIRGLRVVGDELFVLSSGPVGSGQPSDGQVLAFDFVSAKRKVIAKNRNTMNDWCATDATDVYFVEYDDLGPHLRRAARSGGGVVQTVLAAGFMGNPVASDTAVYAWGETGVIAVTKAGLKKEILPDTEGLWPAGVDQHGNLVVTEDETFVQLTGSGHTLITRSPERAWGHVVSGDTLYWEASAHDPDAPTENVVIYRVTIP